ncbi:MAG TPA: FAD-dependent oxidoreductase, partial [Gammaproteobacteria bacterium]|nr:FAD-dependent oxidoreductase [Gammaproteobacteria bacterium]
MSFPKTTDFLVIGGGVMGVTMALSLKRRHPDCTVTLIEKEPEFGRHASGRNSGVLHAGFYYTADSLKARFTREGNRRLTEYCLERGLPINRCGKLVVARDEGELERLGTLLERGRTNGVELREVSAEEAREIEPHARTVGRALYSPTTSTVDPGAVMASLVSDAEAAGVDLRAGVAYLGREGGAVRTSAGRVEAGYMINAAGLYADRVA